MQKVAAPSAPKRKILTSRFVSAATLFLLLFASSQFLYLLDGNYSICKESSRAACIVSYLRGRFQESQKSGNGDTLSSKKLPPLSASYVSDALKPRYNFKSYDQYIQLQLKKTMNPKLRRLWTSRDWRRKVDVFSSIFQKLISDGILKSDHKALCIAARVGQEVLALKEIGVDDSIGVDLVPSLPLVVKGDMHTLPFENNTFDFEFSNAFDHALFPAMFASEVERTLKPGGVFVLHLALKQRPDKYSANDLKSLDPVLQLFKNFDVVHRRDVDAFGLDLELVLRKQLAHNAPEKTSTVQRCSVSKEQQKLIKNAEPLITVEPKKPWLTLKENIKKIKYLSASTDISPFRKHVYIDVGARSYSSSIGSWFVKKYPKQNQAFQIYAVEADQAFAAEYSKRKNVKLLPYAAWVKNESLLFGANIENRAFEGEFGMGRIQSLSAAENLDIVSEDFQTVMGIDFSEWMLNTFSQDNFVVLKMDIEGTEFDLLPKMIETGAICLVDELFLECHYNRWQKSSPKRTLKYNQTYGQCLDLFKSLRGNGVLVHQWW